MYHNTIYLELTYLLVIVIDMGVPFQRIHLLSFSHFITAGACFCAGCVVDRLILVTCVHLFAPESGELVTLKPTRHALNWE